MKWVQQGGFNQCLGAKEMIWNACTVSNSFSDDASKNNNYKSCKDMNAQKLNGPSEK